MTNLSKNAFPDGVFDTGLFARRFTTRIYDHAPCLFLDRDGVLVEETHYLHRIEDIVFVPDVIEAIAETNKAGYPVVLVTNQSGIGRGLYDWRDFEIVQHAINKHLAKHQARLDLVLACAFHVEGQGDYAIADHPWRKPAPGMLLEAARRLRVDLSRSFIVGDRIADLIAGHAAGLSEGALVLTGHGQSEHANEAALKNLQAGSVFTVCVTPDAGSAIRHWLSGVQSKKP